MESLVSGASRLPETIAHFAAGEIELAVVLADLFSLLSAVRLGATQNFIYKENAQLIAEEYEAVAERLTGGGRISPFVTSEDFLLPSMPDEQAVPPLSSSLSSLSHISPHSIMESSAKNNLHIKDTKGQYKGQQKVAPLSQGHEGQKPGQEAQRERYLNKRASTILLFVRKHSGSSIKDISKIVKDCSEKTIQRELSLLIQSGLVEKRGERRWSVYYPL